MSTKSIELETTGLDFLDAQIKRWSKEDFATFAGFLGLKLIPIIELMERKRDNCFRGAISCVVDLQIQDVPENDEVCLTKLRIFLDDVMPKFENIKGESATANKSFLMLLSMVLMAFNDFTKHEQHILKAIKDAIMGYVVSMEKINSRGASDEMQAIANQISMITSFDLNEDSANELANELKIKQAEKEKTSETAH